MTYSEWIRAVDSIVIQACGLPMDCLPDWLSRDAYDDGLTTQEGAEMCLREAGFYGYT